jgi:hypothetical protein
MTWMWKLEIPSFPCSIEISEKFMNDVSFSSQINVAGRHILCLKIACEPWERLRYEGSLLHVYKSNKFKNKQQNFIFWKIFVASYTKIILFAGCKIFGIHLKYLWREICFQLSHNQSDSFRFSPMPLSCASGFVSRGTVQEVRRAHSPVAELLKRP